MAADGDGDERHLGLLKHELVHVTLETRALESRLKEAHKSSASSAALNVTSPVLQQMGSVPGPDFHAVASYQTAGHGGASVPLSMLPYGGATEVDPYTRVLPPHLETANETELQEALDEARSKKYRLGAELEDLGAPSPRHNPSTIT